MPWTFEIYRIVKTNAQQHKHKKITLSTWSLWK